MDYKTVGSRIRTLRHTYGMTQESLAERAQISLQFLSKLECGRCGAGLDVFVRIANALGATMDELLGENITVNTKNGKLDVIVIRDFSKRDTKIIVDTLNALKKILLENEKEAM